jgi:GT2 family glycosyltransferase
MAASPSTALITVVMPVLNGVDTLGRSINSVLQQSYSEWELHAVDDGSTDDSLQRLKEWSAVEPRIKVDSTGRKLGPGAARNKALRAASGEMICYLDCDDEFYPDYLKHVAAWMSKGSVFFFGYDLLDESNPTGEIRTWNPTPHRDVLFAGNLCSPLGVAHRRDLALAVGGFNEDLWCLEDWELWKRFARAGAEFVFVPLKSGLYHVRPSSRSRSPVLTESQQRVFESRRGNAQPLYAANGTQIVRRPVKKILLMGPIFPLDTACAIANALIAALTLLRQTGIECEVFCTSKFDSDVDCEFESYLSNAGFSANTDTTDIGPHRVCVTRVCHDGLQLTLFRTKTTRQSDYVDGEIGTILDYYERFLANHQPDAVVTFNPGPKPDPIVDLLFHVAKCRDIPLVTWLADTSPVSPIVLQNGDYFVVTSRTLSESFLQAVGLVCSVLPPAFDWDTTTAKARCPTAISILDSNLLGDSIVATTIAEEVCRRCPEIPIAAASSTIDLVTTRLAVVPALGLGPYDRTVAAAMINGIPIIASNRGSLPELVGAEGQLIDVPTRCQTNSTETLAPSEVEPWIEAIVRLWRDQRLYDDVSERTSLAALRWHPTRVEPVYREFFSNLTPQPGPALLPGNGNLRERMRLGR